MTDPRPFPRYFQHANGFKDDTAYIRCDGAKGGAIVLKDGSEEVTLSYPLDKCLDRVKAGLWQEVNAANPTDQPRLVLNQYGRQCFDAGYEAAKTHYAALLIAQAAQLETVRQENETLKKELLARVDTMGSPLSVLPQPARGDR